MKKLIVLVCGVLMTVGALATDNTEIIMDQKAAKSAAKNAEQLKTYKGNFSSSTHKASNKLETNSESLLKSKGKMLKAASAEQVDANNSLLFASIDSNQDDQLSRSEFATFHEGKKVSKQFNKMDADHNGVVSKPEYDRFKSAQLATQKAKKNQ